GRGVDPPTVELPGGPRQAVVREGALRVSAAAAARRRRQGTARRRGQGPRGPGPERSDPGGLAGQALRGGVPAGSVRSRRGATGFRGPLPVAAHPRRVAPL